jgi:uncharacterized protein
MKTGLWISSRTTLSGISEEKEAEERFEVILKTIPKYGKNELTLKRYLGYHAEIQGRIRSHKG